MSFQLQFIEASTRKFRSQKGMVESAIAQVSDERLRQSLDQHTNSIAVIMKHMAGNMLSRWTNMLESDGEKPDRARDQEFVDDFPDRAALLEYWELGWSRVFTTLAELRESDFERDVFIRGYRLTLIDAVIRQIEHYGYHAGQIVQLSRHYVDGEWKTLTIARGESEQYNRDHWGPDRPRTA
ncbi:MAG: DinB family protein [Phycisphaerae bacterium]